MRISSLSLTGYDSPIALEEHGAGKPLLCIHGFPEDRQSMIGCLEPVLTTVQGFRRIYVDLPGMGQTQPMRRVHNADDMVTMLLQLIHQAIGDSHFCIAGYSYGGYLGLGLLRALHERIDGALFIAPCVVANHEHRELPRKQRIVWDPDLKAPEGDPDFNDFMEYAVVATPDTWKRYQQEILPGLKSANVDATEQYQKEGYAFSFEAELLNMTFDKPACIITGLQDHCTGFVDAWRQTHRFSRTTFAVLDKAGHNLYIERNALFEALVRDWLSRLE